MSGTRAIPGRAVLLVVGAALGLAACGNAAPRIIGPGVATPTTRPTVATTVPVSLPLPTAPSAPAATTTTTQVAPAVTDQIEAEIGALLSSLRQADSDLDTPNKGDQ